MGHRKEAAATWRPGRMIKVVWWTVRSAVTSPVGNTMACLLVRAARASSNGVSDETLTIPAGNGGKVSDVLAACVS